jgi:pantoate--beta-alanine ligase
MTVPIARNVATLRARVKEWRAAGQSVSVVLTMGSLHDGHLSLVRAAKARSDRVIVTLFVNPKQFNNPADLSCYPRTEENDAVLLAGLETDLLYAPGIGEIYPDGFSTTVSVVGVSEGLCGATRPGHFDGVATVVAKLFLQTGADLAFFGEKDYQQLHVVRQMVRDLDIPITIIACPTVREPDGLALSSRNVHLSPTQRKRARVLSVSLFETADRIAGGAAVENLLETTLQAFEIAGFDRVDYLELRAEDDLRVLQRLDAPARLLAAVTLGTTRLIDNVAVPYNSDRARIATQAPANREVNAL